MDIDTKKEAVRTRLKVSFSYACIVILRNGETKNLFLVWL